MEGSINMVIVFILKIQSVIIRNNNGKTETTSKVLKLPDFYTRDIYGILKWMISEYNTLRMKDENICPCKTSLIAGNSR